jgi:hypothetical protein
LLELADRDGDAKQPPDAPIALMLVAVPSGGRRRRHGKSAPLSAAIRARMGHVGAIDATNSFPWNWGQKTRPRTTHDEELEDEIEVLVSKSTPQKRPVLPFL